MEVKKSHLEQLRSKLAVGDKCTVIRKFGKNKNQTITHEGEVKEIYSNFFIVTMVVRGKTLKTSFNYIDVLMHKNAPVILHKVRKVS